MSKSPQKRKKLSHTLQLPKHERDPDITDKLCQCRPVCKHRRRQWKGRIQDTSAELLVERKPKTDCYRRWPSKVCPNGPCPLIGRTKRLPIRERGALEERSTVVRICQAPVDEHVDTPYLRLADLARALGALGSVHARCAFCNCGACCACNKRSYTPLDGERARRRRDDMRQFDARVKGVCCKKIIYVLLMITVSCYTFHPFFQRFVRLYHQVQVVSDWLAWLLAASCCACAPPHLMSEYSSTDSDAILTPLPRIDPERAGSGEPLRPQVVSVDFTPTPRDTPETATRCIQFWDLVHSKPDLQKIKVHAEKSPYRDVEEAAPVHKKSSASRRRATNSSLPVLKSTGSQHRVQKI